MLLRFADMDILNNIIRFHTAGYESKSKDWYLIKLSVTTLQYGILI